MTGPMMYLRSLLEKTPDAATFLAFWNRAGLSRLR